MMRTTTGTHTGAIPHVRKHSDYEITDVKRATIDRKQLTPEERKVSVSVTLNPPPPTPPVTFIGKPNVTL